MRDYLIKPLVGQPYPMISHGKGVYLYDQMAINILMVRQSNYGRYWAWRKGDCRRY